MRKTLIHKLRIEDIGEPYLSEILLPNDLREITGIRVLMEPGTLHWLFLAFVPYQRQEVGTLSLRQDGVGDIFGQIPVCFARKSEEDYQPMGLNQPAGFTGSEDPWLCGRGETVHPMQIVPQGQRMEVFYKDHINELLNGSYPYEVSIYLDYRTDDDH